MTPTEIIEEARIPGTQSVLVLGSFEKRVTVYAQQVRALNLVDAILSEGLVRQRGGKVAIVGGGAAGITAAVALARGAPDLAALDLFESRSGVLALQHGSRRFLHPHFYDWPAPGSDEPSAGLPIMNWRAGPAGDVAAALRAEFDSAIHGSILNLHPNQRVTKLVPSALGPIRVVVENGTAINRIYEVVILAIGFGLESHLDGETLSYWSPSGLAGPIHTQADEPVLFISGNGDGGLVDFMMGAFDALEHHQICELLMRLDLGGARAELEVIEREAWASADEIDLLENYRVRLRPLIPREVWMEISDRLRPNVRIRLHTRERHLLRRTTALHNRLAVFLILEADRELDRNAIVVTTNAEFEGPIPKRGDVHIAGEAPFMPLRRYLRLGADSKTNLEPFSDLLARYPGACNPPRSATRPESPALAASAYARFAAIQLAAPVPMIGAAEQQLADTISISLSLSGPGRISWSGDFGPDEVSQIWNEGRLVTVYCDIAVAHAALLAPALARLGAHASGLTLRTHDATGWRTSLEALCANRVMPGPDLEMRCVVEGGLPPVGLTTRGEMQLSVLSTTIQRNLDNEVLRRLHAALYAILGPAEAQIGWPIEPALRSKLWDLWVHWQASLELDESARRRFLRLLTSESDCKEGDETLLVGLGPKTVRPYMTKSTIFGLAFAVCSGHPVSPATAYPGNMSFQALTGHSCGVSWIGERTLGTRVATQQAWTTNVVLLSQLREAVQMMDGELRMDRSFSDAASVGLISPAEEPLVIGADDSFVSALEAGEHVVCEYFGSIFQRRSQLARRSLETVADVA